MTARLIRGLFIVFISALSACAVYDAPIVRAALYPEDGRRLLTDADLARYPGAGVLMCYSDFGTLERGAAAWLVGAHDLVVLNAHNFVDRKLVPTHPVADCFFRIAGGDYFSTPIAFGSALLRRGWRADRRGRTEKGDDRVQIILRQRPTGVRGHRPELQLVVRRQ